MDTNTLFDSTPSYLIAADNHNLAANGTSWFDPETWGDKISNAGKLAAVSFLSGVDSFYNTGLAVGNWAGLTDETPHETSAWIASIDSDLGKYYEENKDLADIAGFIGSSLIPGIGGIKLLNAGQKALSAAAKTGFVGSNMAKSMGLLVPETQMFVKLSAAEIANSAGSIGRLNMSTFNALKNGVRQQVLEAAAFETVVQATMYKSPILQNQEGLDIVKNIALGGLVGGVLGGAFEAAGIFGGIKKLSAAAANDTKQYAARAVAEVGTTPQDRILLIAQGMEQRPDLATSLQIQKAFEGTKFTNFENNKAAYEAALMKDKNELRKAVHELAGGDVEHANHVADLVVNMKPSEIQEIFSNMHSMTSLAKKTPAEIEVEKLAIKTLKGSEFNPEHYLDETLSIQHRYTKLIGEGAGTTYNNPPAVVGLVDSIVPAKNQTIKDAVMRFVSDQKFSTKTPFNFVELKGTTAHHVAEARYIWAKNTLKEIPDGTIIHANDVALLERVLADQRAGKTINYQIQLDDGTLMSAIPANKLQDYLQNTKIDLALGMFKNFRGVAEVKAAKSEINNELIARTLNVKTSVLEERLALHETPVEDFFRKEAQDLMHHRNLIKSGVKTEAAEVADTAFMPEYTKSAYKIPADMYDLNGNVIDAMVAIEQRQVLLQEAADRVVAKATGMMPHIFPKISKGHLMSAAITEGAPTAISFMNAGYGSLGSLLQYVGAAVTRPLKDKLRKEALAHIEQPLVALGANKSASIEFELMSNKIAATTEKYIPHPEKQSLYSARMYEWEKKQAEALATGKPFKVAPPELQKGAEVEIKLNHPETYEAIKSHVAATDMHVERMKEVNALYGHTDSRTLGSFRPIRPDPKDYPHFAFVVDDNIVGAGHKTMIHARTEEELKQLARKVPTDKGYRVVFKDDAEAFFKARGEYEFSKTLTDNFIDHELVSKGVNSQFFPKTDPQKIVQDIAQLHIRNAEITATELVRLKYAKEFSFLEDLGEQYTRVSGSKYGGVTKEMEKRGVNPWTDYIKTALDISKASEYGLYYNANRAADKAVSEVVAKVKNVWNSAKQPAELDEINNILQRHGYNSAYYDAALDMLSNHPAPKGELSKFVRTSNAILSKFTLALDFLNSVNNVIGSTILRFTETSQIVKAIREGNSEIAGALVNEAGIKLPGVGDGMFSSTKLIGSAIKDFFSDATGTKELMTRYQSLGTVKTALNHMTAILDDLALRGTETPIQLQGKITSAWQKAKNTGDAFVTHGEKWTGNKFAEEFNRFISSRIMDKLTEPLVTAGKLSRAEADAYINTFVNRVEGNIIASQRPVMFQGPIGQAVGLFQTYQFNLMQQMFRYVAEGTKKDAAMLLGLQGTMYGLNGMPAFNAINKHVIGNMSGNKEHIDLYDLTYGVAGQSAGDWLMYGVPSNILQTNLYSRGDINPRHVSVIPTNFADIPIVSAYARTFMNVKDMFSKIGNGGNMWQTFLQGVEHNGISRPLAGLAQTTQAFGTGGKAFSTSSKGTILGSNDLLSLASLSRLAGGRPIDEAIVNDGVYRIQSYEASRRKERAALDEAVKTTVIAGNSPSESSMDKFIAAYAATGGKQDKFNQYMVNQFKSANTSQAEKIKQQLSNPFNQKMQKLLGGRENYEASVSNELSE